jgi:hypothetical protein
MGIRKLYLKINRTKIIDETIFGEAWPKPEMDRFDATWSTRSQGDKIRRIFANWAIVSFGRFFPLGSFFSKNTEVVLGNLRANLCTYWLWQLGNGLGYILGDF